VYHAIDRLSSISYSAGVRKKAHSRRAGKSSRVNTAKQRKTKGKSHAISPRLQKAPHWGMKPHNADFQTGMENGYPNQFSPLNDRGRRALAIFLDSVLFHDEIPSLLVKGSVPWNMRQRLRSLSATLSEFWNHRDMLDVALGARMIQLKTEIDRSTSQPAPLPRVSPERYRSDLWHFFPPALFCVIARIYECSSKSKPRKMFDDIYALLPTRTQSAGAAKKQVERFKKSNSARVIQIQLIVTDLLTDK
jgi:hypothetical protein